MTSLPDAAAATPWGVVASIDYGHVRIGVALSDSQRSIATPHKTYTRRNLQNDADWFRRLTHDCRVTLFVVGLPVHLDGRESGKSLEARKFGQWLAAETGVAVAYYDERFTTVEAEEQLLAAGLTSKRRKARRDMVAAQILLRDFLESGGKSQDSPGPLDDDDFTPRGS